MEKYLFLREMPYQKHLGVYVSYSKADRSDLIVEVIYHAPQNNSKDAPTSTITYQGPFCPEVILRLTPECYKHDQDFVVIDDKLGEVIVTRVKAKDEKGEEFVFGGLISFAVKGYEGRTENRIDTVSFNKLLAYEEMKEENHLAQPA
ncbi:MAG: hypothetical protein LBL47_02120 [Lactobacillus sp.]|jgi:hypothetical protein|nr:hypothetical protein [Lactobacillus sp.]